MELSSSQLPGSMSGPNGRQRCVYKVNANLANKRSIVANKDLGFSSENMELFAPEAMGRACQVLRGAWPGSMVGEGRGRRAALPALSCPGWCGLIPTLESRNTGKC